MKEPIRVLQVLGTTGLGGAESRVMDLYRNIDRERVQFDFAVHTSKKGYFDEEIEALGGHIYRLPRFGSITGSRIGRRGAVFLKSIPSMPACTGI